MQGTGKEITDFTSCHDELKYEYGKITSIIDQMVLDSNEPSDEMKRLQRHAEKVTDLIDMLPSFINK